MLHSPEGNEGIIVEDPDKNDNEDDNDSDSEEEGEEDEDDEEGDEGEGKEEEEPELARVSYKELKAEFPELFKKHPELKEAFFREQKFTEIYPTIEEAQKAADAQAAYDEVVSAIVEGDASRFVSDLAEESREGLVKFSQSFLPALQEQNKDLYFDVIAPQVRGFVKNVYEQGVRDKDNNIANAAKIVHKILFGGDYSEIEKDSGIFLRGRDNGNNNGNNKQDQELGQKYQELYNKVGDACYSRLDAEIAKGLDDLKKTRAGLMRMIAKDTRERVLAEMEKDSNYKNRMNSLWQRERRQKFSGSLAASIESAFISKARTLIAKHRAMARKEALGKEDTGGNNGKNIREPNRPTGGREARGSGGKMNSERQRKEGLTAKQIFDS